MAVGTVQVYNEAILKMISVGFGGSRWDEAAGDKFAFALATSGYTPDDTDGTVADVQLGNIITSGDGAPMAIGTRSHVHSIGVTRFVGDDANFGASVTVPAVKYLICTMGDYSGGYSLLTTDDLIFWCNLDTSGGTVNSNASDFAVIAPGNNAWFKINPQA